MGEVMARRSRLRARMALVAATSLFVSCGSDGESTQPPPPPTGVLTVTISGLPGGTSAAVTVAGPGGFTRTLTQSETIASLTPGTYTVTGASVTTNDGRYAASPSSQPVNVAAGANPSVVIVNYALATGGLQVNIAGLAAGTAGQVTVTGPNGFSRAMTASETLPVLEPGTYTVTGADVSTADTRYAALPPTQGVAVAAGIVTSVTVLYSAATGSLTVNILGLPQGANAAVTVVGPGNFSRTLTGTTTLTLLAPGNYGVTIGDVQAGNFTFRGAPPLTQTVPVTASTTAIVATVRYLPIDGGLNVAIAGLPAATNAAVTVTGPGGFSSAVQNNVTLQRLVPGTYTVTAAVVNTPGGAFAAAPDVQTVAVAAGTTPSVTVNYALSISLKLEPFLSGLSRPLHLLSPPNDPTRLIIVEQTGLIRIVKNGQLLVQPFLDLTTRAFLPQAADDERGVLGIAFHPQYGANGFFFVYYVDFGNNVVVERFQISGNPDVALPNGTPVLSLAKGDPFHNGGALAFGPDGFLYVGIGDGACCNDPGNNAQNLNTLFGKVLRIDVNSSPYVIPPGNPFVGQPGRRPEIWAFGVRNPWRIDIDAVTGMVYIADVGEDAFEEVNALSLSQAGANLGWNIMEGPQCRGQPGCSTAGLTLPVVSYSHAQGCSVTGGFVYRGAQLPELLGHYFYSDYCTGFLRSFLLANGVATRQRDWAIPAPGSVSSFGRDANGELYVLTLGGGVFRIVTQ